MVNMKEIGEIIRHRRKEKDYSLEKLAEMTNVTRQTLAKWEAGSGAPTVFDLLRLCEAFDCDFGYLIGEYPCTRRVYSDIQAETGLSEDAIQLLNTYKNAPEMTHIIDLLDDLIRDRDSNGINTLSQIASIAHALIALRETIPKGNLQANVNFAGLNWTCQNSFMQFIDRYTKT